MNEVLRQMILFIVGTFPELAGFVYMPNQNLKDPMDDKVRIFLNMTWQEVNNFFNQQDRVDPLISNQQITYDAMVDIRIEGLKPDAVFYLGKIIGLFMRPSPAINPNIWRTIRVEKALNAGYIDTSQALYQFILPIKIQYYENNPHNQDYIEYNEVNIITENN